MFNILKVELALAKLDIDVMRETEFAFYSLLSLFFNLGNKNKKYKVIQISGGAAAAAQWENVALLSCSHHIFSPAQCPLN